MKPICVPCQRFYRVLRNGYQFIESMPIENGARPGTAEPEKWRPYKLWIGDLWRCEGCGHETVAGVAPSPHGEHYQADFAAKVARGNAEQLRINDC